MAKKGQPYASGAWLVEIWLEVVDWRFCEARGVPSRVAIERSDVGASVGRIHRYVQSTSRRDTA